MRAGRERKEGARMARIPSGASRLGGRESFRTGRRGEMRLMFKAYVTRVYLLRERARGGGDTRVLA
jgi:hypothetical protein